MTRTRVTVLIAIAMTCGCSRKDQTSRAELRGPVALSQLSDLQNEVFPLSNGNAYLVSVADKQLFLLSKDRATRITGVDIGGFEASAYPLPDGSAYLVSSNGRKLRLYYLVGNKATLVQEAAIDRAAMVRESLSREAFLWVQTQVASARYRRARAELLLTPEPSD